MQSVPNWRPCRASSAKATQCFVTRRTGWPATLITYENSAGSDGARCPYRLCEGKLDLHWRRFTHVESVAECHAQSAERLFPAPPRFCSNGRASWLSSPPLKWVPEEA